MTCTIAECTSWWWTDELSETCTVSRQNKFVKLVHLVGFITKKFVTMHGHMNVKFVAVYKFEDKRWAFADWPKRPKHAGNAIYVAAVHKLCTWLRQQTFMVWTLNFRENTRIEGFKLSISYNVMQLQTLNVGKCTGVARSDRLVILFFTTRAGTSLGMT
jgi:hypothetical protein